ncbi:MAG: hypothetical protein Q8L60_03730 [Gammaproteobacteria bacterium]|nr:hypothetical protein [Gammaproteobacteria bacterium]MDP2139901.1 hypothetical protein [Gammaproteobacteria bacterium]MDP2347721.1 hypothetical protein [Gammaproteobacteria bacterium]
MRTTDGFKMASSAAALLLASAAISSGASAADVAEPVKISQCQGLTSCHGMSACKGFGNDVGAGKNSCGGIGFVSFASGHAMVSKSFCEKLGGKEVASVSAVPAAAPLEGVQVAYCNDLFSCNTFSACKGNGNDNCAGKNSCHGIGFVAIATGNMTLSEQLCSKLGGNLISGL